MSIFSSVPVTKVSRSTFNLDHENKLSFNFGGLYPILTHTVLPGDRMSLGIQSFIRTVPLLSPVMHRNDIKVDSFFVPFRLIWPNYEKFLQCEDPTIRMPKWNLSSAHTEQSYNVLMGVGSLADYLGFASVPYAALDSEFSQAAIDDRKMNLLPFKAYQIIYDFYYRNKSLETSIFDDANYDILSNTDFELPPSVSYQKYFLIRNRSWRRDPFTSALPDPQKGNPVLMPTGDVSANGDLITNYRDTSDSVSVGTLIGQPAVDGISNVDRVQVSPEGHKYPLQYKSGLKINGPTIEDFRYAEVLEEYEEALARAGAGNTGSFKEWLLSIWRTLSPDARLDRPEYLGGYRGPIQISEVPQTSNSTESSPQGTLAGKGLSVGGQLLFKNHKFKEPGILMTIMSVVPKSSYMQGDPREFLYENCYDFPNPYFANLGEQEVFSQEINASYALCNPNQQKTWGYQVRNYEMKQLPDTVHGALRSSLAYWHEGRIFKDKPTDEGYGSDSLNLNQEFIKMQASEVSRIFPSSESSDKLIGEFFFSFRAKRSLPYYGVPRVGHN